MRRVSPALTRIIALFNARDWDALCAQLASDVELGLVSRAQRRGHNVSSYFSSYAALPGWRLVPGFVDGHEVILVYREAGDAEPSSFIELSLTGRQVRFIRDFWFVPYILTDARVERVRRVRRAR